MPVFNPEPGSLKIGVALGRNAQQLFVGRVHVGKNESGFCKDYTGPLFHSPASTSQQTLTPSPIALKKAKIRAEG